MAADDEKKSTDDGRFRELSPGKLLVWARERAGLTQEQVAKELYMTLTKVRALESDDYRHMGSDTFTRGYLRAYANLVKLDVVQVLAAYDRHAQKHGLVEQVLPRRVESANKPLWQFIVLVLLALLILWLVSIWFFDNRQQPTYNRPMAVVPPVETALNVQSLNESSASHASLSSAALVAAVERQGEGQQSVSIASDGSVSSLRNSSVSSAIESAATSSFMSSVAHSAMPVKQANANQLDSISFSFAEECWLEVSDARGDVLAADLQSAGSSLQLQGAAPFDVKLGNSPAVKIELNGDQVAIVPALGTNVLSIKVGAPTRE
ncbi:MAG TPA: RodZ domain-containing protein [Cellvibrio sp.]